MKTTIEIDEDDLNTMQDMMWTIFDLLPEKMKDRFVEMIMETYELYTMEQALETLADAKSI